MITKLVAARSQLIDHRASVVEDLIRDPCLASVDDDRLVSRRLRTCIAVVNDTVAVAIRFALVEQSVTVAIESIAAGNFFVVAEAVLVAVATWGLDD